MRFGHHRETFPATKAPASELTIMSVRVYRDDKRDDKRDDTLYIQFIED